MLVVPSLTLCSPGDPQSKESLHPEQSVGFRVGGHSSLRGPAVLPGRGPGLCQDFPDTPRTRPNHPGAIPTISAKLSPVWVQVRVFLELAFRNITYRCVR